ncbi:MAG: hypothetical protein JWP25_8245 [Bradyrhizobium sp.]|nr:hypothetical protein [Bradyrhizobium sp.]
MSGRSGYRKTDRKRSRNPSPRAPPSDYVLRFTLPRMLAAFLSPGHHSYGVTIGFNDIVFCTGQNPSHCCQLAADFLDGIGARKCPQAIAATVVKLLPCSAHAPGNFRKNPGIFRPIGSHIDLEAIHDRVSRFADRARPCAIDVRTDAIAFSGGEGWRGVTHDYADERPSHRSRT